MRVLLVGRHQAIEPLGIIALAGVARDAGWERDVVLVRNGDFAPVLARALATRPDLVALSVWTGFHLQSFAVADALRAAGIKVAIGGPHATYNPDECTPHADFVSKGEGFRTFRRILQGTASPGINFDDERLADGFPHPDRDAVYSGHADLAASPIKSIIASIGCPYTCVTGDTALFTDRGLETVEAVATRSAMRARRCVHGEGGHDLYEADIAVPVAAGAGRRTATRIIRHDAREVHRVTADNGMELVATADHRVLSVRDGRPAWVEVKDLKPGDWLTLQGADLSTNAEPVRLSPPATVDLRGTVPQVMDEDLAWLTGYLLGDGCLPTDGRAVVHFALKIGKPSRERVCALVERLFGKSLGITRQANTAKSDNGWLYSRSARSFFEESVGVRGTGTETEKLRVPAVLWWSPRAVVESFLDGLWAADGTTGSQSYLTTVSRTFATEVAWLMLAAGRPAYVQTIEQRGLGHGNCYRVGRLRNDRIPTTEALYRSSKSGKWHWRTPRSSMFLGVRRATLRESGLTHELDVDGRFYVRVGSVTAAGTQPVYDLTVPEGSNFVANGIVVHNCSYCNSPQLNDMYGGFNLNLRPIDDVVREAREIRDRWGAKLIYFQDDVYGFQLRWLEELAARWPAEVGIPWHCQMRLEMTKDERRLDLFKAGGCTGITLAIESGNDWLRRYVLQRGMADNLIVEGIRKIQARGLTLRTEQILAVPFSDLSSDLDTLELNVRLNPTMAWTSILAPYRGLPIGEVAKEFGMYDGTNDQLTETFFNESVLRHVRGGWRAMSVVVTGATSSSKDNPLLRMKRLAGTRERATFVLPGSSAPPAELEYLSLDENTLYNRQCVRLHQLFYWLAKLPRGHVLAAEYLALPEPERTWARLGEMAREHLENETCAGTLAKWRRALEVEMGVVDLPARVAENPWYFVFLPGGGDFARSLLREGVLAVPDPFPTLATRTRHWLFDRALYLLAPARPPIAHSGNGARA